MTVSAAEAGLLIDLAVDTSAVLAVLLREPSCDEILERLCKATQPAIAAPTRTEILLVALVKLGVTGKERAQEFLERQAILSVAWDQELADASAVAFLRFGRGRHPSGLNIGDCFSYALAECLQVPLLFVGNDFSHTDLKPAL
jgi:ribonuclease VapC